MLVSRRTSATGLQVVRCAGQVVIFRRFELIGWVVWPIYLMK
jgi:hypothetical protein